MEGTKHDDVIIGTSEDDAINSRSGNDEIETKEGDDFVAAGEGSDTVNAGDGNDIVLGDVEYQPQENAEQPTNDTSETDDSWGKEHTVLTVDNSNNAGEPAPEQGTHSVKLNDFVVNDTVSTSTSVGGLEQHEEVTIQITDVDGNVAGEQTAKVNDDQTVSVDIELAKEVLGELGLIHI